MREKVKLAAANGTPIAVEGEAILEFEAHGDDCEIKFLDADVRRPFGAVSAIVDQGNTAVSRIRSPTLRTTCQERGYRCT